MSTYRSRLELVSDTEYVELMKSRLDPDGLGRFCARNKIRAVSAIPGIVLLPGFLDEFFPEETLGPDTFTLFHYNGLVRSEASHATYSRGERRDTVTLESGLYWLEILLRGQSLLYYCHLPDQ